MYKELPKNATQLRIHRGGCGSECCDVSYYDIWCHTSDLCPWDNARNNSFRLWEGLAFSNDCDDKEKQEAIDALIKVCNHYGIPTNDMNIENFWDLERDYVINTPV